MRKMILGLIAILGLAGSMTLTSHAETFHGASDWSVKFTNGKKMESNFKTADLDEAISGLQPGDNIIFSMTLKNENDTATDWYMTNKVLHSLEDSSANSGTSGGAYTYRLAYNNNAGEETVLFSSDTVGGENTSPAGEGLHQATNALEDYFYLDTFDTNEGGEVTLEVALDGETQGNDYQDTLADLRINYAVELRPTSTTPPDNPPNNPPHKIVKTGDYMEILPYYIAAFAAGFVLLLLAFFLKRRDRKEA